MDEVADNFLLNKDEVIQIFKQLKWTTKKVLGYSWFINQYGCHCYGPNVDGELKNTMGVMITPGLKVKIAYYKDYGVTRGPYAWFN